MKRGLLLLAALALFGCSMPGSEDGGQELESAAPTEEVAPTPTEVAATPTEAPVASAEAPVQAADVSNPLLVAQGEILYQQHCASCHGVNLEGQPDWRRRSDDGTLPAPPTTPAATPGTTLISCCSRSLSWGRLPWSVADIRAPC